MKDGHYCDFLNSIKSLSICVLFTSVIGLKNIAIRLNKVELPGVRLYAFAIHG